ncbi:polyprotein, partial [Phytophthora megakarya]
NRFPKTTRQGTTPFELVWKEKPSLANMRVFGARGFVYVDGSKRRKCHAKSHQCIFLGYSETSKAFRVRDIEDERFVVSRTIALDERPPTSTQLYNHRIIQLVWRGPSLMTAKRHQRHFESGILKMNASLCRRRLQWTNVPQPVHSCTTTESSS